MGRGAGPTPGTRSPPAQQTGEFPSVAQWSPVSSMQAGLRSPAAPCSSPLRNAWIETKAVCKARWRKTCQGVVHVAQVWETRASRTNWSHWF